MMIDIDPNEFSCLKGVKFDDDNDPAEILSICYGAVEDSLHGTLEAFKEGVKLMERLHSAARKYRFRAESVNDKVFLSTMREAEAWIAEHTE